MLSGARAQAAPLRRGVAWRRAAAAAVVLAAAAGGASAGAAPPPALRARVVVSGSATSYTEVTLSRPLTMPGAAPNVAVSGSGFAGLALIRVQGGIAPPGLVVTRLAGTGALHYAWVGHRHGTFDEDDPATFFTHQLPAGRYRLYLLTTGRTTATWRLPLAAGTVALAPRTMTRLAGKAAVAPGARGSAVAPFYAGEQTATVAHRGMALNVAWYHAHADVDATIGTCTYPGEPSALGLGPAPACLDRDVSSGPTGPAVDHAYVSQGTGFVPPGKWTSKSYVRVSGAVSDGGIGLLLLDLGAGFPAA